MKTLSLIFPFDFAASRMQQNHKRDASDYPPIRKPNKHRVLIKVYTDVSGRPVTYIWMFSIIDFRITAFGCFREMSHFAIIRLFDCWYTARNDSLNMLVTNSIFARVHIEYITNWVVFICIQHFNLKNRPQRNIM